MISYAQNFEDVILSRVFKAQASGFYIDVGAADPTNLSVTKWFYDNGWSGINVEPVHEFYDALKRERPRDVNINCGAGATNGNAVFLEFPTKEWSTFDLNMRPSKEEATEKIRERTVPLRTLDEIIDENAPDRNIDFLKIDVEGLEEQVLLGTNLRKHRPTIILIEAIDRISREQVAGAADKLLRNSDYLSVYFDGINRFYVKREREDLTKEFAIPPNQFDNFKLSSEVELEKVIEMQRAEISQAHIQLDSLTKQIEMQRAEISQAHIQLDSLTKQIEMQRAEISQAHIQLDSLTKQIEMQRAEISQAHIQLDSLTKQVELQRAEISQAHTQLDSLTKQIEARDAFIEEFAWFTETRVGRVARRIVRFLSRRAIVAKRRPGFK